MNRPTALKQLPTSWTFAIAFAILVPIAFLDYTTGWEVSLSILYCVPVFIVAWHCGRQSGILMSLIAALTWWWADVHAGHPYLKSWMESWEVFVRFNFFIITAIGTSAVKHQRDASASRIALLEYTHRLELEIIGISEREQERIGQDLHDGICQSLAALSCGAASLKGDLEEQGLAAEAKVADELAASLREVVGETRNLARGLVPVQMDEAGLSSALDELTASVTRLLGIQCSYEIVGNPVVHDNSVAVHLYRIAQEAINNATKHGKATKILVSVIEDGRKLILQITDNGVGISNTTTASDGKGMGVGLMQYRARLSGGELNMTEANAGGTIVSCEIPLPREEWRQHAA